MNLAAGDDGADGVKRFGDTEPAIVLEPEFTVLGVGVLPGNHENRETLIG